MPFLIDMVLEFPRALVIDVYHLGRAAIRSLVAYYPSSAWYIFRSGVGVGPPNDRAGLAMHFVDDPDILGQNHLSVNVETPHGSGRTPRL